MNNNSLVDYLKMAAGFNRQDPARIAQERRNISPWIQGDNSSNNYTEPPYQNHQPRPMPYPPPPPSLRQNESSQIARSTSFREDISRNPYDEHYNPYYQDINQDRRTEGCVNWTSTDRRSEQQFHIRQNDLHRDYRRNSAQYHTGRSHRPSEGKRQSRDYYQSSYHKERNRHTKDRNKTYKGDSDVECITEIEKNISLTPNSPTGTPSDVSLGSPDISELPPSTNSMAHMNPSIAEELRNPGISQLEKAYNNRRMSQNSDSSEISFIPQSTSTLTRSDQISPHNRESNCHGSSYNTPDSPDR